MGKHEKHTPGSLISPEYLRQRTDTETVAGRIVDLVVARYGIEITEQNRADLLIDTADIIENYDSREGVK